jgi:hypothetical protein
MKIGRLRTALNGLLDRYVQLISSGDCGFWNPEEEDVVKEARAALADDEARQPQPPSPSR